MAGGGSRPGERRGGRQKGTPNKVTAELRYAAREYTEEALKTLAAVMRDRKASAAARVAAAIALLDRGHGRPRQHVEAEVNFLDRLSFEQKRALLEVLDTLEREDQGNADERNQRTH